MRVRRWASAALAVGLSLAAAAATATPQAAAALERCIDTVFAESPTPRLDDAVDLPHACPGLVAAFEAADAPRLRWAGRALSRDVDISELLDLRTLSVAPASQSGIQWRQGPAELSALLEAVLVAKEAEDELGWWDRFLGWLRDLIQRQGDADLSWLETLVDFFSIDEQTGEYLLMGVIVLVLVSFAVLLVHELREAGFFRRWRRRGAVDTTPELVSAPAKVPVRTLAEIRSLGLQHQPAALLGLCIHTLMVRGRLPHDKSRTNREFLRTLPPGPLAKSFGALVRLAESASYGGYALTDASLGLCYTNAEDILHAE